MNLGVAGDRLADPKNAGANRAGGPPLDGEPPFSFIAEELLGGMVVPFLGAGASVFHQRDGVICPPTGSALAEMLADQSEFPQIPEYRRKELPRVASYFEHVQIGRRGLRKVLQRVFQAQFEPNALHELLAKVSKKTALLIITTNYDDMIERAFDRVGSPYHLVITAIEDRDWAGTVKYRAAGTGDFKDVPPTELDVCLDESSIIYKMHGSIDRSKPDGSNYVITEEDYVRFLSGLSPVGLSLVPPRLKTELIPRSFLFLGYSLADWNFRVMLDMLSSASNNNPKDEQRSWAIQRNPDRVEARLWDKKAVNVYDLDLGLFTDRLASELQEAGLPA
jgi:SIR2-like domain